MNPLTKMQKLELIINARKAVMEASKLPSTHSNRMMLLTNAVDAISVLLALEIEAIVEDNVEKEDENDFQGNKDND